MKLSEVLKRPAYLAVAVASSLLMAFVYIYTQVLGNLENVDIWLTIIPPQNAALFVVFAGLFGATLSYQLFLFRQPRTCDIRKGASAGGAGTALTFLVAQCPACASIGALFLPVSVLSVFTVYSAWITLLSIGLLLFTLRYLGAFKKE
jgi:hypothetical protein